MKIIIAITCLLLLLSGTTKAAFTEKETTVANAEQSQLINQLSALANLSRKDYEQLTGRHLSLVERISYHLEMKHLRNELKKTDATASLQQRLFDNYLSPKKGQGARTFLAIIIVLILLFLILILALLGKGH